LRHLEVIKFKQTQTPSLD